MKKVFFLILCCLISNLNAQNQELKTIDTLSIVFKAKLFTVSQHEFESRDDLISKIDKIPYETFGANEFLFIKISGNFYCEDNKDLFTVNWCDCDYYLCYSKEKNVFYFLGGFKENNIKEFAKEYYSSLFISNWKYKIKDAKLSEFLKHLNYKKIKKAKKCFKECIETFN
ncbi:MAG: hypothetical protein KYX68_08180 [Flavobacterium sp.]|nr:hypothetical protein [Flavobacterium sp.]